MNKFLIVFLLLIVLLGANACADVFEEPILFRGVKWGATYKEVINSFSTSVDMGKLSDSEYWYSVKDDLYKKNGNSKKGSIGARSNAYSWDLSGFKVAGYDVDEIELLFTYLPGDDGLLIKDQDHTAFFYAEYKLQPKDADAAYQDLTTKLSSLYGDIDATQEDSFIINYKQNLWYGAEGTYVSLVLEDISNSSEYIYVKYAFDGGDTFMDNAYNALVLEESKNAAANTDGL